MAESKVCSEVDFDSGLLYNKKSRYNLQPYLLSDQNEMIIKNMRFRRNRQDNGGCRVFKPFRNKGPDHLKPG